MLWDDFFRTGTATQTAHQRISQSPRVDILLGYLAAREEYGPPLQSDNIEGDDGNPLSQPKKSLAPSS